MIRTTSALYGLVLAFASCASSQSSEQELLPHQSSDVYSLHLLQWHLQHGAGVSFANEVGWSFDFPVYDKPSTKCAGDKSCGHVNYLTTPITSAITADGLTMTFRVDTTGDPIFNYALNPNNTCINPAAVRLFIQRRDDTLKASHEFYRWWSKSASKLTAGTMTLTVPLTPDHWFSVFGKSGDKDEVTAAEFRAALQNVGNIGMTFGGGCFAGHGVNITGGTARFTLTNYSLTFLGISD